MNHNLKIISSFLDIPDCDRWTWKSPDGNSRNQIDLILTIDLGMIKDNTIITNFLLSSDHRPGKFKLNILTSSLFTGGTNRTAVSSYLSIPVHAREVAKSTLTG